MYNVQQWLFIFFYKTDKQFLQFICLGSNAALLFLQASGGGRGSMCRKRNIAMEIPINTTIAYSLMTVKIKEDGSFGEKLLSNLLIRTNNETN